MPSFSQMFNTWFSIFVPSNKHGKINISNRKKCKYQNSNITALVDYTNLHVRHHSKTIIWLCNHAFNPKESDPFLPFEKKRRPHKCIKHPQKWSHLCQVCGKVLGNPGSWCRVASGSESDPLYSTRHQLRCRWNTL